jgi:hypothetical protein
MKEQSGSEIWSALEWRKFFIARKILEGEKLSPQERSLAAQWITGQTIDPPQTKKPGRPSGVSETAIYDATLFERLRPQCKSDSECHRRMQEMFVEGGVAVTLDSIIKSVASGKKAIRKLKDNLDETAHTDIANGMMKLLEKEVLNKK